MNKINQSNLKNSKSQKNLKISSEKENLINLKLDKKHFPILCSLYDDNKNFNSDLNNINPSLKRSSTENFKKNIFSETGNTLILEENGLKNNSNQEKNNNKQINFNKNRKNNCNMKLKNKKKIINNKKDKNKDLLCYIPNIKKDSLINVITVREAKEMKKGKNNLKFKSKVKVKQFENIKIVRLNNEINFKPIIKSVSNINSINHFEEQIKPITNKKFKDLEIVQVTKEKLNTNSTKKFENIDICQTEKDFHIIDEKNKNFIKSDTISENFSGENIQEKILSKIEVKHIQDLKFNPKNKKIFSGLERIKETEYSFIDLNKNKEQINNEENKENNNNCNINMNNNNNNHYDKVIYNQSSKKNIITNENNNQNESEINNNKNSQNDYHDSKENSKESKKSSSNDHEEFNSKDPGLINHIYLKSVKPNILNTNPRNKDYSQINNQYDSDSRINNISNIEKVIDKSSIDAIKMDSQNYSKLIKDIEIGEANIYKNEDNKQNDKNKEISNKENKNNTDVQFDNKNCLTFTENKTNNSNKIIIINK